MMLPKLSLLGMMRVHMTFVTALGLPLDSVPLPPSKPSLSPPSLAGTSPHQHHYPHHDAASAEALCSPGWAKISGKMGRFRLDKGTLTAQLGRVSKLMGQREQVDTRFLTTT
jgi:hypothetical protein